MAISDILSGVGTGLARAGKAAVPVLERTAQVVSGEAPQIDAEQRKQQEKLEDEQINVKATALENQLAMGQKYGTLTPQQQQQYIDSISGLYSHPRHAGTLMEKLRKAIHPDGAFAQGPQAPLPDANPPGGTAHADMANALQLASARKATQQKKGFDQFLDVYARDNGIEDPSQITEAQLEDAHTKYYQQTHQQMLDKEIVEDPQSPTGFSVSEIDRRTGKQVSSFQGVKPPAGFIPKHRVSYSKDQYGNETTTVSDVTPMMGKSGGTGSTGAKSVGGILGSQPSTGAKPVSSGPRKSVLPKQAAGQHGLDANGHIPSGAGNPQVTELANELLDGRDAKDLPMKARAAAESMARQYGWEQGTLTPKEKILVNEAGTKLNQLQGSPSLSVLDSFESRAKIAQVLSSNEKEGFIGRTVGAYAAGKLTPQEQEFIRLYNAAIGTITGLTPITRGGRPSEASVQRLIAEMPNVLQSGSSSDARARIQQLLNEVKVATQTKGNTPVGAALGGASQPEVWVRDASGKLVKQ
jgi:hypothetical protein